MSKFSLDYARRVGRSVRDALDLHLAHVPVVPGVKLRGRARETLNRTPDLSDWAFHSSFYKALYDLRSPPHIHRKAWEFAVCLEGLERLGVVTPQARALSVGAGTEAPLFYFANKIEMMTAVDLYDSTHTEGNPAMLTSPWSFAPYEYRRDHLRVMQMSGCDLHFSAESFNFVFCLSSIEHFGPRAAIIQALAEIKRVLRPGGVACIITELILHGEPHNEYFMPREMETIFLSDPFFALTGGPARMDIAAELMTLAVDVTDPHFIDQSPHIVLADKHRMWTSFSMFLKKASI